MDDLGALRCLFGDDDIVFVIETLRTQPTLYLTSMPFTAIIMMKLYYCKHLNTRLLIYPGLQQDGYTRVNSADSRTDAPHAGKAPATLVDLIVPVHAGIVHISIGPISSRKQRTVFIFYLHIITRKHHEFTSKCPETHKERSVTSRVKQWLSATHVMSVR